MDVLPKVLGLTVAGVLVIVLYLSVPVLGALFGSANPMSFMIYLGLALTALFTTGVMVMASVGSTRS